MVTIREVSFEAFGVLIKFCYTGDRSLVVGHKENIRHILVMLIPNSIILWEADVTSAHTILLFGP
jgi:hypothetical protein